MRTGHDVSALDQPEVLKYLFHPRKDPVQAVSQDGVDFFIPVEKGVRLSARLYPADPEGPHILFFHGNGEIASDYDTIGPVYNQYGISFLVVDYRGYGQSTGLPTASNLLSDSHSAFKEVQCWLEGQGRTGLIIIMGRSLGSAAVLEIACCYQDEIAGMILDSAFARTLPLLTRLGVPTDTLGISEMDGFGNFGKIRDIGKPTLIIHGEKDEIIPLEDADILLANSSSMRKQLLLAPGCGHNDILLRCGEAYFKTISHFVEMLKRLKKKAAKGRGFDRRYPRR
ncbi:MAG: alpha/beta hydrolase [Deltaproteobacteria bacterium]|jgi:pimeloyl-ACP methyl ester carboxylesterase|nr:alpha/beta hydrolase [Deltaproteobacteria bacterium]